MYVCVCHGVSERTVAAAIACGAHDEDAVGARTGAGTSCGTCVDRICEMLQAARDGKTLLRTAG